MPENPGPQPLPRLSRSEIRPPESEPQKPVANLRMIAESLRADRVRVWEIGPRRRRELREAWARPAADGAEPRVDETVDGRRLSKLLQLAVAQRSPIWIEKQPNDRTAIESSSSFSTHVPVDAGQAFRIMACLSTTDDRLLVLDIEWESRTASVSIEDRKLYLEAVHRLADSEFLKSSTNASTSSARTTATSIGPLEGLHRVVDAQRARTVRLLERELSKLEGTRLDSLQENQAMTSRLHQLLDSAGLRVRCPQCGQPAILRCLSTGNTTTGSFVFDHYLEEGRTFHGGRTTLPRLLLIAKPPRKLAAKNDSCLVKHVSGGTQP